MRTICQNVESAFFLGEPFDSGLDGGQICEVDLHELDSPFALRVFSFQFFNSCICLRLAPTCEVACSIPLIEDFGEFKSNARIATGDNEYTPRLVREILLCESWLRDEEALAPETFDLSHDGA